MFFKKFNLSKPVTKNFFNIYKLNIFLFLFLFLFFLLFISFLFCFIFYNFVFKNNKYFFLKFFFFEFFLIFLPFNFISLIFFYSVFFILKIKKNYNIYLNLKIISYQWKWYFSYLNLLDNNINFFSVFYNCIFKILNYNNIDYYNKNFYSQIVDKKLILPINKCIRMIFFSNDVIHSLHLPSFGLKQDSIPGFLKNFYFKPNKLGRYFGFCSELCGKNHSYMPFILKVLTFHCYKKWILSFLFRKKITLNF